MSPLRIALYIVIIIASVIVTILVLAQEGKQQGLGAISGAAETYWGKNKGRSMEGKMVKITGVLVALIIILAVVMNLRFI
ncbi:MAG: preprotein translocase subunit SecG [Lachnospiraceae bacterium]|nr:preprotein translocase subunit SecG [Candidatus Merdinaster equi]